jgi:Zn-finger nucleic acid-binding protein
MVTNEVITKKAKITYNMCEKCGSLWLDAGDLDRMAFTVKGSIEFCSEEVDKTPEKKVLKCPRCDDFDLVRVHFLDSTDIVLHHCRNCEGFWLDGGELNLIDEELAKDMPVSGKGFSEFVNNVHVPYWFKKIQKKSSETDYKIEVLPIKGSDLLKPTGDKCPSCGQTLNLYSFSSMKYEGCAKCRGLWLVKDELRKLKNQYEVGRLHWLNDEIDDIENTSFIKTNRPCVKCAGVKMVSTLFAHTSLIIDWCPQCHGMWLDRREYQTIIQYLVDEAGKAKPQDLKREIAKDAKRILTGGPEGRLAEIGDTEADIIALLNTRIFEHPQVFNAIMELTGAGRNFGA